jgi:hypothetical protein
VESAAFEDGFDAAVQMVLETWKNRLSIPESRDMMTLDCIMLPMKLRMMAKIGRPMATQS